MTQYNGIKIKLLDSQLGKLGKLKLTGRNESGVTLRLSPSAIGNDDTKFSRKLLPIDK